VGTGRLNNATAKPNLTLNSGTLTYLAYNAPGAVSGESLGTAALPERVCRSSTRVMRQLRPAGATSTLNIAGVTRSAGLRSASCQHRGHHLPGAEPNDNQILIPTPASRLRHSSRLQRYGSERHPRNGTSNILPYAQVGAGAPGSNLKHRRLRRDLRLRCQYRLRGLCRDGLTTRRQRRLSIRRSANGLGGSVLGRQRCRQPNGRRAQLDGVPIAIPGSI